MSSQLPHSACCFIVRDGKVLAVSRRDDETVLGLPGGKQEPDEKLITTAARETWEETGIVVTGLRLLYEGECNNSWCSTFHVHSFIGEPRDMPGEGHVSWVSPDQLFHGVFGEYNKEVVRRWVKPVGSLLDNAATT